MYSDEASSAPPAALRLHWDVFLSFRGEDTRRGITKSLHAAMKEHGVRIFIDDEGMTQGDEIAPHLLAAIDDSAASIVMLSPRYADSHWCLEELARLCELGRLMLPVFFKVNPSDVRNQRGPFEKDFVSHRSKYGEEKAGKWMKAMAKAGSKSGWVFDGSNEKQLIQQLVRRVLAELRRTPVSTATYTVGVDSRVERLMKLIDVRASNCSKVLGLYGMGGVGKTTLATAIYNKIIGHFEVRCFISSVSQISHKGGLVALQRKLVRGISSNAMLPLDDDFDGMMALVARVLQQKPVLLVLDDVSDITQLNAVAGNRDWFHEGSRVIITTRDKDNLDEHIVNDFHEVRELYKSEALQLFSYHSQRRDTPTREYLSLSEEIVSLTGHLPLALEVFGSYLFHKRSVPVWKDALQNLRNVQPQNLQDVLKLSYDGLEDYEKRVFLDIACLFVEIGMERWEATDVLKACGFRAAETTIADLVAKSLIKIREPNILWVHDQLRAMARQIVTHDSPSDPGMRTRLWDHDVIMNMLKNKKGTRCVEAIILDFRKKHFVEFPRAGPIHQGNNLFTLSTILSTVSYLAEKCIRYFWLGLDKEQTKSTLKTDAFKPMVNLRLLQINHASVEGSFRNFPPELKWLQWKECPLNHLPSDFDPAQLAILDLSESAMKQVWGWGCKKVGENLMIMNLHGCYNLLAVPDLSGYRSLEKLDLSRCPKLISIHKSVGNLRTLLHLNLEECLSLVELPSDVSGLKLLETLTLSGCRSLKNLPGGIGSMVSLKELMVDKTSISELPDSIFRLTKLEKLSLDNCQSLKRLPTSLGSLIALKVLSVDGSGLEELPESVGSLSNLEKLRLAWCGSLTKLPESIGNLLSLQEISISRSAVEEIPATIGRLSYLKELSAGGCNHLTKLPDSIGGLASLVYLDLDETSITALPNEIGDLKMISRLDLHKCKCLKALPESIGKMLTLSELLLFDTDITELPESIGNLENLALLNLNNCRKLHKLPASVGGLKTLHHLLMENTAITELPESFGMMSDLVTLKMSKKRVQSFSTMQAENKRVTLPTTFSNLTRLIEFDARSWRLSGRIPEDLNNLSLLQLLDLGYNNFTSLPASLSGLGYLEKLFLCNCEELKSLPPLPPSLLELDASNCFALETVSNLSNLKQLNFLNITNCIKVMDIPGLECLENLKRLYMSGCRECSYTVRTRLSKVCLRNLRNLSMPGTQIPGWFSREATFSEQRNREIKAVVVCVVISVESERPESLMGDDLPVVPGIQASAVHVDNKHVFSTTLYLPGVPKSNEDQIHLCRFSHFHPLVSLLRDGYKIGIQKQDLPFYKWIHLKNIGIHLVFEGDDDYGGDEDILDESQHSLSQRLSNFFRTTM